MQLINTLMAGFRGAENGVAQLFVYGTSTRATYYADFEGTVSSTTGADLPLDSNGGAVVYVNQLVDLKVFDANGLLLRDFTDGDAAPNVEVQSLAFTGVNRSTGVSAAGQPTTLQAILDLWLVSAGAIDWKVLFNGTATSLQVAVASVAGLFFNVKDPTYGAAGDGSTDDTTAIQNCITAAGLVKGTVIFPAGTYRTTSKLTIPVDTSLWGVGAGGSIIRLDHATNDTMEWGNGSSVEYQEVRNLQLTANQPNSGKVVSILSTAIRKVAFYNCIIGSTSTNTTGTVITVANNSHDVLLDGCIVTANAAANTALNADQTLPRVQCRNTVFNLGLGTYNGSGVIVRNGYFTACRFDLSAASIGTHGALVLDGTAGAGPKVTINGCEFVASTATCAAITVQNANEATTAVAESGNIFRGAWTTVFSGFTAQSNIPSMLASTRQSLGKNITDNTASVNVLADQFGYTVLTRTTNGNQTLTTSVGAGGAEFTLIIFNNSGGASGTMTFGAGFASTTTAIAAIANGKMALQHFRAVYVNGAAAWLPVAASISGI